MSDANIGLLESFLNEIFVAKQVDASRSLQLSGQFAAWRPEFDSQDAAAREAARQEVLNELKDAVSQAMGGDSQAPPPPRGARVININPPTQQAQPASHLVMRAIERQGNFIARRHRAAVLRHATYARRVMHTIARRESHSNKGGFYDRRVETPVVNTLKKATS